MYGTAKYQTETLERDGTLVIGKTAAKAAQRRDPRGASNGEKHGSAVVHNRGTEASPDRRQ